MFFTKLAKGVAWMALVVGGLMILVSAPQLFGGTGSIAELRWPARNMEIGIIMALVGIGFGMMAEISTSLRNKI